MTMAAPTRFSSAGLLRLVKVAGVLILTLAVVLVAVAAYLTFRILSARNLVENVTPQSSFQTNYENLSFTDRRGGVHEGWLLLGLRGAPVILLCHGHESNRSELLSIGTVLRQNHFNVYLFNFDAGAANRKFSDLGVSEVDVVLDAITFITGQTGVNQHRVGLFGSNTGGFAALAAAQRSQQVKALAVDSVYEAPRQMFEAQVERFLGESSAVFRILADLEFRLVTIGQQAPPVSKELEKLEGIPKLYISGRELPLLARATERIYEQSPQPKRLLVMEHSLSAVATGAEKKEYEHQVLTFFLHSLPLRAD
jgi:esterase/lipase